MIRADASPQVGGGHISRCLALADRLTDSGWTCLLATRADTLAVWPDIEQRLSVLFIPSSTAPADEAAYLFASLPQGCELLIVDHYGLDITFEGTCRGWSDHIFVIDDLANRPHDADWLLDQTPGRQPDAYSELVPVSCGFLIGPEYALLRPEFAIQRQALRRREAGINALLVTFGASDPGDITSQVVEVLLGMNIAPKIDVVIGTGHPATAQLEHSAESNPGLTIHHTTDQFSILMQRADLCIGAGGVTALERCCLGLPSLVIRTAENQNTMVAGLQATGAICDIGFAPSMSRAEIRENLQAALSRMTADRILAMSSASAAVCDGRGLWRVLLALLKPQITSLGKAVTLRLAEQDDTGLIFHWQNEPGIRQYFRNPAPLEWQGHCTWIEQTLSNPNRLLLLAEVEGAPAAMIRLDDDTAFLSVSILVAHRFQGHGIGKAALRMAAEVLPRRAYRADIHRDNKASQLIFLATGYQPLSGETYELPPRLP